MLRTRGGVIGGAAALGAMAALALAAVSPPAAPVVEAGAGGRAQPPGIALPWPVAAATASDAGWQPVSRAADLDPTDAWERLVATDRTIADDGDRLARDEVAISGIAGATAQGTAGDRTAPPQGGAAAGNDTLESLVADHSAVLAQFDGALQAEYELYRAAAADPSSATHLLAKASSMPGALDAVRADLDALRAQLDQEATIAQAETRLQQLGSLDSAQLAAIRHHEAFLVPLVAPVSQGFGPTGFAMEPPRTFSGRFYPHFHTGIDLAAPLNTPVHAAADGVVLVATSSRDGNGRLVGYGNYVVVAHPDGFVTLYGHLAALSVHAGDVVHQGQVIGFEGSTGWSTGPHLHFEVRHNGVLQDPAAYLGQQLGH